MAMNLSTGEPMEKDENWRGRTPSYRHFFATLRLKTGYDIRTIQELPGRKDAKTTMLDTHVLNRFIQTV
jgi:site-specific recombinase XerD